MQALNAIIVAYLSGHGVIVAYLAVFAILFAETGLLIGFFLPGDSLLIAVGLLASKTHLSLPVLVIVAATGAILGNTAGYAIGKRFGPAVFNGRNSRFFKKEWVDEAHEYFNRYGKSTLIITRFTPVIRTFIPTIAGVSKMEYGTFFLYNVIGAIAWAAVIILGGNFLSIHFPAISNHITLIELLIIVASLVVGFNHLRTLGKNGH
jgi:membrane-associated protein